MLKNSYADAAAAIVKDRWYRTAFWTMNHTDSVEASYPSRIRFWKTSVSRLARSLRSDETERARDLVAALPHDYSFLFHRLELDRDREVLLRIVARLCLDAERVPLIDLRRERALLRRLRQDVDAYADPSSSVDHHGWKMQQMDLNRYGMDFSFYVNDIVLLYSFVKRQYEYPEVGFVVQPGDVVLDGGACYGDNALYFASLLKGEGRVYTFEMVPGNLEILRANLALNPQLAASIEIVEQPMHEKSGENFYIHKRRAGAFISSEPPAAPASGVRVVESTSIDDFVNQRGLDRLDLIKMDIEGSEMDALRGAVHAIQRFRPKLAICVYHKPSDLDAIPRFIASIDPSYRFYLRHHSGALMETVLYCQ